MKHDILFSFPLFSQQPNGGASSSVNFLWWDFVWDLGIWLMGIGHVLEFVVFQWFSMGSASSMLTQYDIEEVQEHCNKLCGFTLSMSYFVGFLYFVVYFWIKCSFVWNSVSQQEIVSLYQRFCQLDRNAKGFISADEFLSVPEFAMNPLSQVICLDCLRAWMRDFW